MKLRFAILTSAALALGVLGTAALLRAEDEPAGGAGAGTEKVSIDLDKSPRIVSYQLRRLGNAQLAALERHPDQPKYKPVYEALLTRKGVDRKYRQEAVDALAKLDKSDPALVLLDAIGKADPEDKATLRDLVGLLSAQKPQALAAQREKLKSLATTSENPTVKQVAYGALAAADGKPDEAWKLASEQPDGLKSLLAGLSTVADPKVRERFYPLVKPLAEKAPDEATQAAAVDALSYIPGHEDEQFKLLAGLVQSGQGAVRDAAVRSTRRIPAAKWPKDQIEPLAKAVVKDIEKMPGEQRTTAQGIEAVQLGDDLAAALPPAQGAPIRKALRSLGVRVVLVHTLREQVLYDLRYFVVEAAKPVQIVLDNTDNMPHNIVITAPGALEEVATAGNAMAPSGDPEKKDFVPENPKVLEATKLVQPDESITLNFNAPDKPGEYPFVCTFPGHWVRMYGVMLVVKDIEAWDQSPKPPNDPITHKPFESQKNEAGGTAPAAADAAGAAAAHHHE